MPRVQLLRRLLPSAVSLLSTAVILPSALLAQADRGTIRGRVMIGVGQAPMRGASVEVRRRQDTTVVQRVASGGDGLFVVRGVPLATYQVTIRALGYTPQTRPAVLSATTRELNLGDVILTAAVTELQALKVVEQTRRAVELAPDRNTFRVADFPTTGGGSAIDVLRNIPSVDVDIDNQVSLRGDAGVIVQINGRRSPLKPAQLGNYLSQLPAAMVERVEVISNPSARDNAEGSSGIINVVLKSRSAAGSSGGLTLAQGTTRRTDLGGNYGWQGDRVTVYGSYGYLQDRRPRTEQLDRQNFVAVPLTQLDQSGTRVQLPRAHTGTIALRFNPSKQDELAFDGSYSDRRETNTGLILYRTLDANNRVASVRDRASDQHNVEGNKEASLEYKHAFGEDHEISAELRTVDASEGGRSIYASQLYAVTGEANGTAAREATNAFEYPHEKSAKVDYQRPFGEGIQWQLGYRGGSQPLRTSLDTRLPDVSGALTVADLTRSNAFTFTQQVQAGYTMLTGRAGPVRLQGGIRVEATTANYRRASGALTFDRSYTNAFPSGLVTWDLDAGHQLKASWSSRIRRPDDPDQLDPTIRFQDPLNLSRGNPDLRPELVNAYEVGYQHTSKLATLQLTPFVRRTRDAIRRLRTIDAAGVTTTTFANIATVTAWGTDATIALRQARVTGFVGGSVFGQQSDAGNIAPQLSARTFGWSARANTNVKLTRTLDLQALVTYRARLTVEQGSNASQTRVNVAVRQKLRGDRVNLTVRITDPFATEWERSYTSDPAFYQISQRNRQVRGVLLNLTWIFGKPPKEFREKDNLVDDRGD